jgi:hypothetical protein
MYRLLNCAADCMKCRLFVVCGYRVEHKFVSITGSEAAFCQILRHRRRLANSKTQFSQAGSLDGLELTCPALRNECLVLSNKLDISSSRAKGR